MKAVTPSWLLNLAPTDRLREVKAAYEDMDVRDTAAERFQ